MVLDLDVPRLEPASGGPARQLVVLVHGYGADGNDLIALGREWRKLLPDAAFVSPHAPDPCGMGGAGFEWFELTMRDPAEFWRGVNHAGPAFDAFLDGELERYGLDDSSLALVGFSQGTMMSLHVGLRRRQEIAAIVGFSGALAGPEHLEREIRSKPPVLLVHGDQDQVIPFQAMFIASQALAKAGINVQWHLSPGMAHGIDPAGFKLAGDFLKQAFTGAFVEIGRPGGAAASAGSRS